jgi:GNAT superfamily N-acetyltransferase
MEGAYIMIFESLWESAQKGELILVDGGLCHFHLRRDSQLTIREIIVLPEYQYQGVGKRILESLKQRDCTSIFAKCPAPLAANGWYKRMEFILEDVSYSKSGTKIYHWRLKNE